MPQDHCTVRSWGPNVLIRSMSERTRGQQRCSLAIQTNVSSLVDFRCPRNRHSRHRDVRAETWWQAPAHNVQKPKPQLGMSCECLMQAKWNMRPEKWLSHWIHLFEIILGIKSKAQQNHRCSSYFVSNIHHTYLLVYPIWTHILLKAGCGLSIMVDLNDAAGSRQWQGFDTCPRLRAQAVAQGSSNDTGWLVNMPILGS